MKISLVKVILKSKVKYYPGRYSSTTVCRVYKDGIYFKDIVASNHGGFNKVVDKIKSTWNPEYTFDVDKKGFTYNTGY